MFIHPDILPPEEPNDKPTFTVKDVLDRKFTHGFTIQIDAQPPRFKPGDVVRKRGKQVRMTVQSVFPPASGRWRYWVHYVWDGQVYAKVMDESDLEAK